MLIASGNVFAQDFDWDGSQSTDITNDANWVGNNKPTFSSQTEVWNFDTAVSNSPSINQPNLVLGGFHFRSNSGAYSITGNQVYNVFGFDENGTTYAVFNDNANIQTISNSGNINFHGTDLSFETGDGGIHFTGSTDYTNTTRTIFTGNGNMEFSGTINVNSVRFQFSNSGQNDVRVAFNSAEELVIDGGSTTTFFQNTSVNNSGTLVTNFSVARFNSTFNSNELVIDNGAEVYISGNATHNGGIDLLCGTLLLERSNPIGNHNLNAMGGVFNLQGFNENLNSLSLSENSTIDFGSSSGNNSLSFQGAGTFTTGTMLTVLNWENGDSFQVLNIGSTNAQQVRFYGDFGADGLGFYQANLNGNTLSPGNFLYATAPDHINCVPTQVVPEPSTYIFGGVLLIGSLFEFRRRRRSA
ncbi:MAG: hypothetical protein AAFX93_00580 [Verrucomicrobiota bacterium]